MTASAGAAKQITDAKQGLDRKGFCMLFTAKLYPFRLLLDPLKRSKKCYHCHCWPFLNFSDQRGKGREFQGKRVTGF